MTEVSSGALSPFKGSVEAKAVFLGVAVEYGL